MKNQLGKNPLSLAHQGKWGGALILCLCLASITFASVPTSGKERKEAIGNPTHVEVQPSAIQLNGRFSTQQIVVTGHYRDEKVRDLTPFCRFQTESAPIATVGENGIVFPHQDGETKLTVQVGGKTHKISVKVAKMTAEEPVSFRHDVIASLGVGGCNSGACHGTPSGKNGFKLRLRGYDPAADYFELTHDLMGRRVNRLNPDSSLIILKALGHIPHEGGKRFDKESLPAKILLSWLEDGLQSDPEDLPTVSHLQILPGARVLHAPAQWQQLVVLAHFTDGSVRDVTPLTVFSSSDETIASVSKKGFVEFHKAGEVAILCRYLLNLQPVRLAYLEPKEGFVWSNPPENNYVDRHVFAKLKMLNIQPSELCSNEEFLRRAYLDLCAVLPTPEEAERFLNDNDRNKREKLIEQLLNRQEFADFWTLKWMDVLRSTRSKIGLDGAKAYQNWMKNHIKRNTPLDRVVRELLTAEGNTFQNGPANYYLATKSPEELAETTAQLFFGVRMQCAKCHNHPFEKWTQDDYYSTAAVFARVKQKRLCKKLIGKVLGSPILHGEPGRCAPFADESGHGSKIPGRESSRGR